MVIVPRSRASLALIALAACLVGAHLLGLTSAISLDAARSHVERAGAYGPFVFSGVLIAATLLQIPGVPLVMLAPAVFDITTAMLVSVLASHVAVALNFEAVRRVGGTPLKAVRSPLLVRMLGQLSAHPVRTVALLRAITVMFPPVTSALALTAVRRRDHLVGTVLGMTPPLVIIVVIAAWLVAA